MTITRKLKTGKAALAAGAAALTLSLPGMAAPVITGTLDGTTLANALLGGGGVGIDLTTVNITVSGNQIGTGAFSAGTYTNATEYGLAPGIIIGSGAVESFGTGNTTNYGTPATATQLALLQPISGPLFSYNDVTEITITFDMLPGFSSIFFNVAFQSVEFPVFVGSSFIDAFGLYVNGTNIAFVDGDQINIDHPWMGNDVNFGNGVLGSANAGVGNNAIGPFFHTFSSGVNAVSNTATFIIADTGDTALDSYAFISQLGGTLPPSEVPEPGTLALFGLGLAGISLLRRRREEV